jgi:hypothetical protein
MAAVEGLTDVGLDMIEMLQSMNQRIAALEEGNANVQ